MARINEILEVYKDRLINLSGRNRSLNMKKIYKKRAYDLYNCINNFNDENELINYFIKRDKKLIKIVCDPYLQRDESIRKLKKRISKEKEKEIANLSIKLPQEELVREVKRIEENYINAYSSEEKKVNKEFNRVVDLSKGLSYLKREINSTEKETGRYELFVGYPYVEGSLQDGTFVRAPIFIMPVTLNKHGNEWYIKNIVDQEIQLNKVFVYAYMKFNNIKINDIEFNYSSLDSLGEDYIKGLVEYLRKHKILIRANDKKLEKFINYTNDKLPDYNLGELVLKNYIILGQFPISNSIYNDYLELEKKEISNNTVTKLLINKKNDNNNQNSFDEKDRKVFEKEINVISELDISQEKAVKKVKSSDNIVIYGPPGTGKSQTITNIIADSLFDGKRILMVSQKRAALDVIYNRLSSINEKIMVLHDANKDKKSFYNKLSLLNESIREKDGSIIRDKKEKNNQIIRRNAKSVDEKIVKLDAIAEELHKKRDNNMSIQEMYSKVDYTIIKNRDFMVVYNAINDGNSVVFNIEHNELLEIIKNIKEGDYDICQNYLYYINKYPSLDYIKDDLDLLDYDSFLVDRSTILRVINDYHNHIETNKELKYLTMNYFYKTENMKIDIKEIAEKYTLENYDSLLKPLNDNRWWSMVYWFNYSKNKRQEEENLKKFNDINDNTNKVFNNFYDYHNNNINTICTFKRILNQNKYSELIKKVYSGEVISEEMKSLFNSFEFYEEFKKIKNKYKQISFNNKSISRMIYSNKKIDKDFFINNIMNAYYIHHIRKYEKTSSFNLLREYENFKTIKNEVINSMNTKQNVIPDTIIDLWDYKFNSLSFGYREYSRQSKKKRRLWPIRRFIEEFKELTLAQFPCWLLSPEVVSEIMPLNEGIFDVIIFDEASQIFIENSVPTIYRGKKIIVAGDDKQLKPSSLFRSKYDTYDEEDDEYDIESAAAYEEESLLDLAKINFNSTHLNYHYRSKYAELINFSNYGFYNGSLMISPNVIQNKNKPPITRIKVEGSWIDRKNIEEAKKVSELIEHILINRKNKETIGVITFNISQKDIIEDVLEQKSMENSKFNKLISAELNRKVNNEDYSLFVKNIENVQGDERDIIIFSTAYAKNEKGRLYTNFGSLSQEGGENRLNVAISRAKKQIFVITSIEPEELHVDNSLNAGPKYFKEYLKYVREVSNNNNEEAVKILNRLLDTDIVINNYMKYDSEFEAQVSEELQKLGYIVHTQIGVSGYRIDLGIFDKKLSKYVLGIECDGATYHSSKSARERDIHRQRYLESRGWTIERIWSRDWFINKRKIIINIDKLIKQILNEENSRVEYETINLKDSICAKLNSKDKLKKEKVIPIVKKDKKVRKPINKSKQLEFIDLDNLKDNTVWYGDTVTIVDCSDGLTDVISLEKNPYNRHLMKAIEKEVLSRRLGEKFKFREYTYKINNIQKRKAN